MAFLAAVMPVLMLQTPADLAPWSLLHLGYNRGSVTTFIWTQARLKVRLDKEL